MNASDAEFKWSNAVRQVDAMNATFKSSGDLNVAFMAL